MQNIMIVTSKVGKRIQFIQYVIRTTKTKASKKREWGSEGGKKEEKEKKLEVDKDLEDVQNLYAKIYKKIFQFLMSNGCTENIWIT